jgi:hypothetical protein
MMRAIAGAIAAAVFMSMGMSAAVAASGTVKIGNFSVPLPPGEFNLIHEAVSSAHGSRRVPIARAVYGQMRDGRVAALVVLSSNTEAIQGSWSRDPAICDRKDAYFAWSDDAYNNKSADCRYVGFITTAAAQNHSEHMASAREWARQHGASGVLVGDVSSVARGKFFVAASYFFNPDLAGIAPTSKKQSKSNSPWALDEYREDPRKVDFYEKVKQFGDAMLPNLRASLDGASSFPALPAVLPPAR